MSITSTAFKSLTMAESCLISSPSSLFYNKTKHPFFSLPSKPLKFHFSSLNNNNYNNPSPLSLSITTKTTQHHHRYPGPVFVAQTSDWAQQEGDNTLTTLQDHQEGEEEEGVSETEAGLSDWDVPSGEGGEGEEEEGGFVEPPEEAKLFVGSLPFDVDSQKLAMLFEQAGTVEIAEVIYNRETDQSRGFGFVTMSTVEEAERAVEKFNRYDYNGRVLVVNKASPRGSRPERQPRNSGPVFRVYVGNLPWDVDNTRLEQVFSEHGKVVNARVVYDRDSGRSRGFGFVTMTDETGMNDAIAALDGQSLDGRTIRVSVAESRRGLF